MDLVSARAVRTGQRVTETLVVATAHMKHRAAIRTHDAMRGAVLTRSPERERASKEEHSPNTTHVVDATP